jgi:proteasome activator subunit 4
MATNDVVASLLGPPASGDISGTSTPVGTWRNPNGQSDDSNGQASDKLTRSRPRTYNYFKYLPYDAEPPAQSLENLDVCIKHLYIAISSGDFTPGAVHWTREIRGWLALKFEMPVDTRVRLVKLYYELSLAPGLDNVVSERFASMFMVLTKWVLHDIPSTSKLTNAQA